MYELQVKGMRCGHCVSTVTKSVQALDATAKVDVDLAQQTVRVASIAKLDDIKSAVSDSGFPVLSSTVS